MRVSDFTTPLSRPPADSNPITDAPQPAQVPDAIDTGFSLVQLLEPSAKALNRQLENMLVCPSGVGKGLEGASVESLAQYFTSGECCAALETKHIRWQMWAQQVCQSGQVLSHCRDTLPLEQRRALYDEQDHLLGKLQKLPAPDDIAGSFNAEVNSSSEFFDKLLELISLIKNGYLDRYGHIITAYSDFFAAFNAQVTASLKDWIAGANDGKEVKLDAGALGKALAGLIAKYSLPEPASVLFPKPGEGGTRREEADKWREALGLPADCLKRNADGSFCVVIDIGPLSTMAASLPPDGTVTWDTARFQAWQTGFNAQEERMKNMLQSLTQKYSNANAYHDNFNKTLSAHLNQYTDMLKAMLSF